MKKQQFKEKGITLIALVITIIVLLILAGVTLSILLQTGIIENSQRAVNLYQSKAEDEIKQIDELAIQMQKQFGMLDNTEGKENKTITGEKSTYNNPVIPVGFKTSNDGASWKSSDGKTVDGWNDGLVIEDKEGNQFVWVPAYVGEDENGEYGKNNVPKYEKILGPNSMDLTKDDLETKIIDDKLPKGIENEESQIEYGGFYIGRYEAGTELEYDNRNNTEKIKDVKPLSKQGQMPWNNIDYENAKERAENMYKTNEVQSVLVTGTMWDTVMKWLELSGVDNVENQTRENAWGNYYDVEVTGVSGYYSDYKMENFVSAESKPENESYILKTGESDYTKRKNIYDLAGNLWEWTNEIYDSSICIRRGGCCNDYVKSYNMLFRNGYSWSAAYSNSSFRVGLYIK